MGRSRWPTMLLLGSVLAATVGCGGGSSTCTPASGCGSSEYCTLVMSPADLLAGRIVWGCVARARLGETCEPASDLDVNACEDGAYCALQSGSYLCKPVVAMGGACPGYDSGPFVCAGGGVCLGTSTRTCQEGGGEGAGCVTGPGECALGFFCDGETHTCATRLPAGGTCTPQTTICPADHTSAADCTVFSGQCAVGLYCRMTTATECVSWMDCDMETERCCITDTGTACVPDTEECVEPTGTCGA